MVVGCTGEDNLSAMARVGSAAVFHSESVSFVDADEKLTAFVELGTAIREHSTC
jgi:hypothetical protein